MTNEILIKLVIQARQGNTQALETILKSFERFINKFSSCVYMKNYDYYDIVQECYLSLMLAIHKCDLEKYNFVGYATSTMKNNIFCKIRKLSRQNTETSLDKKLCNESEATFEDLLEYINSDIENVFLYNAINSLNAEDHELLVYVFFLGYTLREYSKLKGISYGICSRKKREILKELKRKLK